MTDKEDREGVYRALQDHRNELHLALLTEEAAAIEIAIQLRRIGNSLEALADTRTSIAVSLDRIANVIEKRLGSRAVEPPLY